MKTSSQMGTGLRAGWVVFCSGSGVFTIDCISDWLTPERRYSRVPTKAVGRLLLVFAVSEHH